MVLGSAEISYRIIDWKAPWTKAETTYAACSYIINQIQEFKQKLDVDNHYCIQTMNWITD